MNTNFHATKDRTRGVSVDRHHMGGEQYRREMREALHELQQRLGQCHNGPGGVRVLVIPSPAPSIECRIRRKLFQKLRSFYTFFTSCGLL
jgi:hypothetical protein